MKTRGNVELYLITLTTIFEQAADGKQKLKQVRAYINKLPRECCDVATQKSNIYIKLYQTIQMQHFIELINNISLYRNCTDYTHMLHHTVDHWRYNS